MTISDDGPRMALNDSPGVLFGYFYPYRNFRQAVPQCRQSANAFYLSNSQSRHGMSTSKEPISHVVLMRSNVEMARIHTSTIVAMMQDVFASRHARNEEIVKGPMGVLRPSLIRDVAIPVKTHSGQPEPATAGDLNLGDEALLIWRQGVQCPKQSRQSHGRVYTMSLHEMSRG